MVGQLVCWGLFAAWMIHDLEEWATMPGWSQRAAARMSQRHPRVPGRLWSLVRMSRPQATIAIGLVGAVIAWASWAGARTGGRSGFFQIVLIAFGLHAIFHVAQSVVTRGYTPGVITAPLIVAPYSWWAWQRVQHAGIASPGGGSWVLAIVLFPPVVIGARLIAAGIDRAVVHRVPRRSGERR